MISTINSIIDEYQSILSNLIVAYWQGDRDINFNEVQGWSYKERLNFLNKNLKQKMDSLPNIATTYTNIQVDLQKYNRRKFRPSERGHGDRNKVEFML